MTNRTSAWIRLIIWSLVALVLVSILVSVIFLGKTGSYFYIGANYSEKAGFQLGGATVEADGIRKIEIDWDRGDITIDLGQGDQIAFEESGASSLSDKERMRYRVRDGVLTIVPRGSSGIFHFGRAADKHLTVSMPATLPELEIDAVSGEVQVSGTATEALELDSLQIETVSGAVMLERVTAARLQIETVSGRIHCDGSFGEIKTETVSGNAEFVSMQAPESVDCESVSGKISLQIPQNSGFRADYDSVSGKFTCEFPAGIEGGRAVYGDGSRQYKFETISGDMEILRADAEGGGQ